jgi:retron-type reverse transcriptase
MDFDKGAANALDALMVSIKSRRVNWILDANIAAFFDGLRLDAEISEHRMADQRLLRLIRKWQSRGDRGRAWGRGDQGNTQGAVSPLLANIYLHYALDLWTQQWRADMHGARVSIVRYADDSVIG